MNVLIVGGGPASGSGSPQHVGLRTGIVADRIGGQVNEQPPESLYHRERQLPVLNFF